MARFPAFPPSLPDSSAVSGAGKPPPWGTDISWLIPTHRPVMLPEQQSSFATVTQAGMVVSYDATGGGTGEGASIKLVRTTENTTSRSSTIPFPLGTEYAAKPVMVGPEVHVELECNDWTQVQRLYAGFYKVGDLNSYRYFKLVESNASDFGCTDPVMAPLAWNGKTRLFVLHMDRQQAPVGTPDPWDVDNPDMAAGGMILTANQVSAATGFTIHIRNVYCPKWPVGFVSLILDGAYKSARDLVLPAFAQRGWRCGMSANRVDGGTFGVTTYPTFADLAAAAAAGHDVFNHGHNYVAGAANGWDETQQIILMAEQLARQRQALAGEMPANWRGNDWGQWLQNKGFAVDATYPAGANVAGLLRRLGIQAARGSTVDHEFGYNPTPPATKTPQWDNSPWSASGARVGGWVSPLGRFNRKFTELWLRPNGGLETPTTRDTYAGNALAGGVKYAAACGAGIHAYAHNLLPNDGTNPAANDAGTTLWRDFLADLDDKVKAGKLLVLSPTEVERVTYWREGPVRVRWDGRWVNSLDGSKAF